MTTVQESHPRVRVVEVNRISDAFLRAELEGSALAGLELPGVPDEACVFYFPLPEGGHDHLGRWYTLRRVTPDATRATIDVLCHDGGVGAGWARRAAVGDELGISRVNSWFRRPADARWQVLIGDAAVLPAIARIVEESPDGLATEVVAELTEGSEQAQGAEIPPMPSGARVRRVSAAPGTSALDEIVRGLELPDGPGYVYVCGEAAATRAARKVLRHERGLRPVDYGVLGYWRRDAERFRKRYEAAPDRFAQAWAEAEAGGGGDEERVLDLYESKLSEAGLI
ncbi:siderophore-interacting protein [Pseudonocardia sp. KRD291]|uniref:siderophore-interacting protein n=1 Tax=Pseudonocardia sp. KRD291 TaxID=2792007 RepID=UPI001C4A1B16|nr:siderophore-interacting protein [Pseudonocardia sp. KRD291]MBW0105837.1 siderophore-interacting protein [Pseudonocardia sp. KRD291]